jgi:DIRP
MDHVLHMLTFYFSRYNHDVVGADLAKLGIKSNQELTVRQWKTIRRLIRPRPRRFSQNFIASQLSERNMYRCTVRRLQNNPHLLAPSGFPFDVPAPIAVGTIVTAYCKVFRMIQRGKVVAFEKSSSVYFIEFESKQFGYELCPDSDVSTSGLPSILVKAPPTKYLACKKNGSIGHSMGCGTGTGPLLGKILLVTIR